MKRRQYTALFRCCTCLAMAMALSLPAYGDALPPAQAADRPSPMVRGATEQIELKKDQAKRFSFAIDGPGLITLVWTEPGKAYAITITDPKGKFVPIRGDRAHAVKDHATVRTALLRLAKPGSYQMKMTAPIDTQLHLGYAWMPMKQVKDDNIKDTPFDIRKKTLHNSNTPDLLVANTAARDIHHWSTATPRVPIGYVAKHASPSSIAKRYHFPADGPGILTLAVRGEEDADMAVGFNSHALKPKLKGHLDEDQHGDAGAEQAAILIPSPDNITVEVDPLGSGGSYAFSGSWISLEGVIQQRPAHERD